MELQTENGKKKVPLSAGLKWLRLVCMAVAFGIIAGGVMVGMNYLGGSMASEEESIPQTSTVKVTAKAEDSDAVVAVAREAMPSVVTISTMSVEEMRSFFGGTQEIQVQGAGTGVIVNKNESELLIATNNHFPHPPLLYHFFSMSAVCQQGENLRSSKQRIGLRQRRFGERLQEYACERVVNFDFSMDMGQNIGVES